MAINETVKMTLASHPPNQSTDKASADGDRAVLQSFDAEVLAQALAEKLAISNHDWHKLSANRNIRAREQAAAALVYMLKGKPEEALPRLQQAVGWLDKTLKAPPCPTHKEKSMATANSKAIDSTATSSVQKS